jgi:hypothetical protein
LLGNQRIELVTSLTSARGSTGLVIIEFLKEKENRFGKKYQEGDYFRDLVC